MESALGWLGRVMSAVGSLVPRLSICKATHGGVAFVRGKNVKRINPGLYFWWPLWTETVQYPVVRQSLNLPSQTLTTTDEVAVTAGAVVVYKVTDIEKALAEQWDIAETISDLSQAAVCEFISRSEFSWINQNRAVVRRRLTKAVASALEPYGVEVMGAWLTDFARTRVLSVVGITQSRLSTADTDDA